MVANDGRRLRAMGLKRVAAEAAAKPPCACSPQEKSMASANSPSPADFNDERGDVVLAAVLVGRTHEGIAGGLRVGRLAQNAGDLVVMNHLPQPIRAEQEPHARSPP